MTRTTSPRVLATLAILFVLSSRAASQETILSIAEAPGEYDLGKVMMPFGDYDNDGKDDILVVSTIGATEVVRIINADGTVLATHALGTSVGTAEDMGDINGDGVRDYAVSANSGFIAVGPFPGVPVAFPTFNSIPMPGATSNDITIHSGVDGSVIHTISAPVGSSLGYFGASLANIGDLDGDGVDDLATCDRQASTNNLTSNGAAFVYSGATASLLLQVDGTANYEYLGCGVSRAGDMNADGTVDLLVSIQGDQGTNTLTGTGTDRVLVVSGFDGATLATHIMPPNPTPGLIYFVFEAEGGHDINGDGTNDIVISRSSDTTGGPNSGRILTLSGADGSILNDFQGQPCQGIGFGIDLADINGDGCADVISGNQTDTPNIQNEATVISGLTNEVMIKAAASAHNVFKVSRAGDFDGDGYEDFMLLHYDFDLTLGSTVGKITAVAGGPALGSTAKSMVGDNLGQPEDVLKVDFKTGGQLHCVGCDMGTSITFSIDQPSMNPVPADFMIFGRLGVPMGNETYSVPGVSGDMTMVPAPMVTWAIPMVFTLASSVGPVAGGEVFQTGPAPWSYTMVGGIQFPMEFTLEGVIMQDSTTVAKTNAVIVRVN